MRIPINLSSSPYENLRPLYAAMCAAALSLLALASLVVWRDLQTRHETRLLTEQIRQVENDLQELQKAQQGLEQWLRTPAVQQIRANSAFLNALIARKSLSWTQIFMDLETILPQQAQITSIRPSLNQSQQAELNLTVAAPDAAPLVQFLKNLESSPRFGPPAVESQRFPTGRAGDSNILLELSAGYDPLAPAPEPVALAAEPLAKPRALEAAAPSSPAPVEAAAPATLATPEATPPSRLIVPGAAALPMNPSAAPQADTAQTSPPPAAREATAPPVNPRRAVQAPTWQFGPPPTASEAATPPTNPGTAPEQEEAEQEEEP